MAFTGVSTYSPTFLGYSQKQGWSLLRSVLLPKVEGLLMTDFQFKFQNVNCSLC